jgi:SAM-dependent methyltransferase
VTDYADVAATYDAVYADRLSRAEDRAVSRLIRPWLDDRDVLDVGCGTGLALALSSPRTYHGMDSCPEMILQARTRWAGADGVSFFTGNADLDEPFADAYDTIVCLWAWPYFTDPQRVLRSWMRALRPRGDALILSWDARHTPTLRIDQPSLAAPMSLVGSLAADAGFDPWPLGGLCGRVRGRRIARTLPIGIASRIIETGAEAPQWLLRLHKPERYLPRIHRVYQDQEAV